ncbi:MAG: anti-phage dCTP deaminase [Pseudomonadota bacterium]
MKHYERGNPKPELVIGIAGPTGTDLPSVADSLTELLRAYKYESFQIRVSDLIQSVCSEEVVRTIGDEKFDQRVKYLMNAADLIRTEVGSGAALIPLIVSRIRFLRQSFLLDEGCDTDFEDVELYNRCYIINSLKHPDEVRLLRKIYGSKFIMISAFSSFQKRKENLVSQIQKSIKTTDSGGLQERANNLIELDRKRPGSRIGQNLSSTFHLADLFISQDEKFETELKRLLSLVFGHPYVTPTRDEMHMFEAQAVAFRSADLSRQIGAIIVDRDGFVVARGCNEVPLPSGGAHWSDDEQRNDNRDFTTGRDFNAVKKIDIVKELMEFLNQKGHLTEDIGKDVNATVADLIFGKFQSEFKDLRVSNLIEFGRVVHAEMHAFIEAARRGTSVDEGTVYTTTFPCHMCGRHIIAAGINRVVYIEPYPKSMTGELFNREIVLDDEDGEREPIEGSVTFEPFNGVAPRFFQEVFSAPKRKDENGYTIKYNNYQAQPRFTNLSTSHLSREAVLSAQIARISKIKTIDEISDER